MDKPRREILGIVLLFVVSLSSYLTIVQIVNAFKHEKMLNSLNVKSMRGSNSTSHQFVIGDTLELKAECKWANAYVLRIYQNSSIKNWAFAFIYKCIMIPLNIYLMMAAWDRLHALGAV